MFALGVLAWVYDRDLDLVRAQIRHEFRKKKADVADTNVALMELGVEWARENLDVTTAWRGPYLGPFDWLLEIIGFRRAVIRGTWGFPE